MDEHREAAAAALLAGGLELLTPLGRGSSSTVYLARVQQARPELPAGSEVAVKVLRPELAEDPRAAARILAEGELGLAVRSPYVARMFAIEPGPPPYLVMERIAGKTLRKLLDDGGALAEDLVRRIGLDAARGLDALHRLRIVHRDVKAENLALTPDGHVKIMDLGLARRGGAPGAGSGGFSGSLLYAAPEVLRGRKAGPAADLYALGMVLLEAISGRHPFHDAGTADELLRRQIEQEPPRASHVAPRTSPFLEDLLQALLAKDPGRRLRRAAELAEALEAGERSRFWRQREAAAPVLASRERLRALRRFAPTPFFGRRAEAAAIEQWLAEAARGLGVAVKVTGPRGIGRRRLLDECLERWLAERDDVVLLGGKAGHDAEQARGMPFPALLVDWLLRGDAEDSPHAAARLLARLRAETDLDPREAEQLAGLLCGKDPGASPQARADLLARALLALARPGRVLVLRIERAEQLSSTGRLVVARLVDALATRPVLLLLVAHQGPTGLPRGLAELALQGLAEGEWLAFGRALFAAGEAPAGLLREAHALLGGSPGNLLEALDDLVQRSALRGRPGGYLGLDEAGELRPPLPLLARLRRRVERMPPEQGFVVKAAAVLGDGAAVADLAALTGKPELEVLDALSAFQGRIVAAERGRLAFRHRDYRKAILELLPAPAQQRLHRTAAWILEERGKGPLEVGLHLSKAGMHEAAIPPLLAGLERLAEGGSRRAAVRIAERLRLHLAHAAQGPAHDRQRLRWLLLAARAWHHAGQPARAARAAKEAWQQARVLDDATSRATALTLLAEMAWQAARLRPARRLAAWAEAAAAGRDDPRARAAAALAASWSARIACELGSSRAVLPRLRQELARLAADDPLRAHLLVDLARLEALHTCYGTALRNLERAERTLRRAPDALAQLRVHVVRGSILAQLGDDDGATAALEAGLARALQLADRRGEARALLGLAELAERGGAIPRASALSFDALAAATATGDRAVRTLAALQLERLGLALAGVVAEAEQLDAPVPRVLAALRAAEHALARDPTAAAQALARARAIDDACTLPLSLHVRVLAATGRKERARARIAAVAARVAPGMRRRFMELAQGWLAPLPLSAEPEPR